MALEAASKNDFGSFFTNLVDNFQHEAAKTFNSLGDFLKQLQIHLANMHQISGEIAKVDSHFAMRLWTLVKDVSSLRGYYHKIYNSTEGVVNYGTSAIIYEIQQLIKGKEYQEATEIIESFLDNLKARIKMVETDIDEMKQDYSVDWGGIKEKIENIHEDYDGAKGRLDEDIKNAQVKRGELLKLGTRTFFYIVAGTAAGGTIVSLLPNTNVGGVMKQIAEGMGTEAVTFAVDNVLKGLNVVASNVPADLQKKVESNASQVRNCLNGFFEIVTRFHEKIEAVIKGIDTLKKLNSALQVGLQSKSIDEKNIADWINISTYLQQIYSALTYLQSEILEKETHKKTIDEIDKAMDELISGITVTTKGTPI